MEENMENSTEEKKYWGSKFYGSKLNTLLLIVLIVLMVIALRWMSQNKETYLPIISNEQPNIVKETYIYTNHGFSIELPKDYVPKEYPPDKGSITIFLPEGDITYVSDLSIWDPKIGRLAGYTYDNDEKIGDLIFKVYEYKGQSDAHTLYWFAKGNVAYILSNKTIAEAFKFIGWPQVIPIPTPTPTPVPTPTMTVIEKIKAKDNGPLSECIIDGKKYFLARGSVFDGSDNVYSSNGGLVANCGGGWGSRPDPYSQICIDIKEAQCKDI